ncbi:MAG: hypothetical protein ACT4RN_17590 [Pseudonocardia sp.]
MSGFVVAARRWARGWELHIVDEHGAEVGVTQSRSLAGAEVMVRDYLALDHDADPDSFVVQVRADLDDDLVARVTAAREATQRAEQAQRDAAEQTRAVARALRDAGLSGADIAAVLGVSPQRVSQLLGAVGRAMPRPRAETPPAAGARRRA